MLPRPDDLEAAVAVSYLLREEEPCEYVMSNFGLLVVLWDAPSEIIWVSANMYHYIANACGV
jgi:hypothetical protein